jgi:hypothetical protein
MALPTSNTTCDIYRTGRSPPAAPDVAGVKCYLAPKGQSSLTTQYYTHVMLVAPTTDVRDDLVASGLTVGPNADTVYVPDKTGVMYQVLLVRRDGRGTALDHKEVLLLRRVSPTNFWPSDNV